MAKAFDDAWKQWIQHNVQRGCSLDELFRILVDEGFDYESVRRELRHTPAVDLAVIANPLKPPASFTAGEVPQKPDQGLMPGLKSLSSRQLEIYTSDHFLSPQECGELVDLMRGHLRQSEISAADEQDRSFRISRTCHFDQLDHPLVHTIDDRICRAMQTTRAYAEPTQAQYYDVGGVFKPHTDYFESYEVDKYSTATLGQRTWTFMIYLNEPEGGGETAFTAAGLVLPPITGRAVIWNNLLPNGQPNPGSIHQGSPVTKGFKAIITKWFRAPRSRAGSS
jgi:prolyl 4-hydroxylase